MQPRFRSHSRAAAELQPGYGIRQTKFSRKSPTASFQVRRLTPSIDNSVSSGACDEHLFIHVVYEPFHPGSAPVDPSDRLTPSQRPISRRSDYSMPSLRPRVGPS